MRKIVAFFLAMTFLLGVMPVYSVSAAAYSGTCGGEGNESNVIWSFDSATGTLSITGSGPMENWYHEMDLSMASGFGFNVDDYLPADKDYVYTPWYSFRDKILHAVVGDGITTLGDFTFSGCENLQDVKVSKDLTAIGHAAFENCVSLANITIPDGVTSIGVGAFYSNMSLTSVTVPEGVESLGHGAFAFCAGLKQIELPSTLDSIHAAAFVWCRKLTSIKIPAGVRGIGAYAFYQCTVLSGVTFLGSLEYINQKAFADCPYLNNLTIPETVTSIDGTAFDGCKRLVNFYVFPGSYGETFCKTKYTDSKYTITTIQHEWSVVKTVRPTCDEEGYTLEECSICGLQRKVNIVPAVVHVFGDWVVDKAPTCTEEGLQERVCEDCGMKDTEVIKATGHSYKTEVIPSTCERQGYTIYSCSCGDRYIDDYTLILEHSYGEWETLVPATCSENGEQQRECSVCGRKEYRVLEATDHIYDAYETPATCTTQGYTKYTCACGESYVGNTVEPLGHNFGEWISTVPGVERRTCDSCGGIQVRKKSPPYDVDRNGTVSNEDLTLLMSILVGETPSDGKDVDMDFDGELTIYDCVLLMQYLETI